MNSAVITISGMNDKTSRRILTPEQEQARQNLRRLWDQRKNELKTKGEKLTQEGAAEQMGYSGQQVVSHYLNGFVALNFEAVLKFAAVLRCSPKDIYPDIIPYGMDEMISEAFKERSAQNTEVLKIAETIESLSSFQRAALRSYIAALTDPDDDRQTNAD